MRGATKRADPSACSGCSLCLLVCPAWRATRDPRTSPEGRAKALQAGATPAEIASSVLACTLCGACEPVCPEEIDLVGMVLGLRRELPDTPERQALRVRVNGSGEAAARPGGQTLLLAGTTLRASAPVLARVLALLDASVCDDAGEDVAEAIGAGVPVPVRRWEQFLAPLRAARRIVVEDGLWMRHLRAWLPGKRLSGLGEALTALEPVRRALRPDDLLVIEARAYHEDFERLVKHYDRLRVERGCATNLDLQRIAIPAFEPEWILKGRRVARIVVERMEDAAAFVPTSPAPVVHLAELADH